MTDLSVGKNVNTSKGIRLTFSVPGVKSTDKVYVLHQLSSGEWETLKPTSISNGQVMVTLYSFSPVAIVRYPSNVNVPVSDPTKNQTENAEIKEVIIEVLGRMGKGRAGEIQLAIQATDKEKYATLTNQRTSAILKQMIDEG